MHSCGEIDCQRAEARPGLSFPLYIFFKVYSDRGGEHGRARTGPSEAQGAQRKGQGEDEEGPLQGPSLRSTALRRLRERLPPRRGVRPHCCIYFLNFIVSRTNVNQLGGSESLTGFRGQRD